MARKYNSSSQKKRRTTLTLPAESLAQAKRIARSRKVNLSTVVSDALVAGLQLNMAAERSEQLLQAYKVAFSGFSADELAILDGVILEPAAKSRT